MFLDDFSKTLQNLTHLVWYEFMFNQDIERRDVVNFYLLSDFEHLKCVKSIKF